jgi:PhzF family phenazine biosynthesis protein
MEKWGSPISQSSFFPIFHILKGYNKKRLAMKQCPLYQIDAFAGEPFTGNPAAVVIMDEWPEIQTMQNIAMENNLSETAFLVKEDTVYNVRYFTPTIEVDLCGHATLASGFVLFTFYNEMNPITFRTISKGDLYVNKQDKHIILNFPIDYFKVISLPEFTIEALKIEPSEIYLGRNDMMLVYENEDQIREMNPNFEMISKIPTRGIMVTAPGIEVDFVSRFFAPQSGIPEDPVTGSAHTTLIPYWAKRLGKTKMVARQLSKRGGTIYCELCGDRVKIGGKAIHYLTGEISI